MSSYSVVLFSAWQCNAKDWFGLAYGLISSFLSWLSEFLKRPVSFLLLEESIPIFNLLPNLKMRKLLFFTVLLLPFLKATAQDYIAGTVITNTSDSIRGFIRKETDIALAHQIEFKGLEGSQEIQSFLPSQIKGFLVEGRRYESVEVEEAQNKKNYFLKCLVKGPASLYLFRKSSMEELYYLKDSLGTLYKLELIIEQTPGYIRTNERYKRTLRYCLKDCPDVAKMVTNTRYEDKDLLELVEKYNRCIAPNTASATYSKKVKPSFNFDIGAGAFLKNDLTMYSAKALLEVSYPELSKNIVFKVGLNYFTSIKYSKKYISNYQVDRELLSIPVLCTYEFGRKRFVPSVYAGFSLAIANPGISYKPYNYSPDGKGFLGKTILPGVVFGLGLDCLVTKRVALTADIRYQIYWQSSIGVSYRFKNKF